MRIGTAERAGRESTDHHGESPAGGDHDPSGVVTFRFRQQNVCVDAVAMQNEQHRADEFTKKGRHRESPVERRGGCRVDSSANSAEHSLRGAAVGGGEDRAATTERLRFDGSSPTAKALNFLRWFVKFLGWTPAS